MLEHADAGNLVVYRLARQIAIVQQFDAHPSGEPGLRNAFPRHLQLLRAQGHAVRLHAVVLRRMNHQRTPAAADIEKLLAGCSDNLRQMCSSLACCAASRSTSGVSK